MVKICDSDFQFRTFVIEKMEKDAAQFPIIPESMIIFQQVRRHVG